MLTRCLSQALVLVDTRRARTVPMRRLWAGLGSLLFFLLAPGFVAGLAPWWISRWHMQPPLLGLSLLRVAGATLIALGTPSLLRLVYAIRLARAGHACPNLSNQAFGGHGPLPPCAQSHVRRSRVGDSRAGSASRECARPG